MRTMVDVVGFLLESMTGSVLLIVNPLSVAKLLFLIGVRAVAFTVLLWLHLVKVVIGLHLHLCWNAMVLAIAFISLPIRILIALHRERTLEMHLHDMQVHLENLVWENKELQERLQMAIKERKVIETVLKEVEEEDEKVLARIDLLEIEELKEENFQLNEVKAKTLRNCKSCEEDSNVHDSSSLGSIYGAQSWSSSHKGSGLALQDILTHEDPWSNINQNKLQNQDILKIAASYPFSAHMAPGIVTVDVALERRRVVALYRSLFSAVLSLLVGMIIWEAEDPCMPLVAALFTVVGLSLSSVVQFLSTIKNKPASNAVALLSINWFILGTLTSPSLPTIAHALVPQTIRLADQMVSWTGFAAYHSS